MSAPWPYTYIDDSDGDRLHIHGASAAAYVEIIDETREITTAVGIPAEQRREVAAALAGDDYRVVPAKDYELTTDAALEKAHADLRAILDALGLGDHSRPYSAHECVQRDVLPAIERLIRDRAQYPRVQGMCPSCGVGPLFRAEEGLITCSWVDCKEPDAAANLLAEPLQPDRPEPVDPESIQVGQVVEIEHAEWALRGEVAEVDDSEPHMRLAIPLPGVRRPIWPDLTGATVRILHTAEPEPDEAAVEALAEVVRNIARDGNAELDEEWVERHARALARCGVEVEVLDVE